MEPQGKVCSRCNEFKSASEFYRQGERHESLCKNCKKSSRVKREKVVENDSIKNAESKSRQTFSSEERGRSHAAISGNHDRETVKQFDESIFYPEERRRAFGISDDDMDSIVAYFRWQMDQLEKRKKRTEEENL